MYTIFINDNVIYLTDNWELKAKENFYSFNDLDLDRILEKIENSDLKTVYLYDKNLESLWSQFKNHFDIIEASGGVVFNEHQDVLWIYRNQRWDLPKGKIEKGESKEIAAVREVEEECGIQNVVLKKYLDTTYHIYEYKDKRILKFTYWYTMYAENQLLSPQTEEGITKVAWLNKMTMNEAIDDTYESIKLLFN